jgi:hypothetical protein
MWRAPFSIIGHGHERCLLRAVMETIPRQQVKNKRLTAVLIAAISLSILQGAQQQDPELTKAIREWTTKPEFLSPLVDHLPKVAGVPSPIPAVLTDEGRERRRKDFFPFSNSQR